MHYAFSYVIESSKIDHILYSQNCISSLKEELWHKLCIYVFTGLKLHFDQVFGQMLMKKFLDYMLIL